jgi:type II secretory pathway component PulF
MSLRNISNYAKQFSTTLNAALPINRALETLARTAPTRQMRSASREVNKSISAGSTLTQALEKQSHVFPDFFIKMIHVGESTGRLEHVAASLASYYEKRYEIAREARRELYPILAYFSLLLVALLFVLYIIGDLATLRTSADVAAWTLLIGMTLWAAYYFSRSFRQAMGTALFHIPFVHRLVRKFCLSKFCEGMELAWGAGMEVRTAITLSAEAAGNAAFRKRVLRARNSIEHGALVSQALQKTGVFPFEAVQIFTVGEETGKLHESMKNVARLAREQATEQLRLTLVLGIRAIYVVGILYIGFVIISFYSRIYSGLLGR